MAAVTPLEHMLANLFNREDRLLDPMERVSEVLFALIMVLTFTCSFSVADAGREEVRTMLWGALGCNLAWAIIDAVFYLMDCFSSRGRAILNLGELQKASCPSDGHRIIRQALPPMLASVLSISELEGIRQRLNDIRDIPKKPGLSGREWMGALAVFLAVILSTLPVIAPFAAIHNARTALRTSNVIAIVMLMVAGYAFGKYAGHRPWRMAIAMVLVSAVMVGITISLGG